VLRVLFVQDSGINESLALTDLSAVLRAAGHEVWLVLGDEVRDLGRSIRRFDPDLAIIPCPVAGHDRALQDAAAVRRASPEAFVLLGGTHATFTPELALRPEVDAVCIGESDGAVPELADRIERSLDWRDVRNLAVEVDGELVTNPMRPPVQDLDALPMPDREIYFQYPFIARLPWKKFTTGRGCVHTCAYCWNTTMSAMYEGMGRFVRRKSPRRAIDEILAVKAHHPLDAVHFSDDLFTTHPEWLAEFADLYPVEVGIPFTCNTSIPLSTDRAMRELARAGCRAVAIGLETGNEDLRSRILGKEVTNDHAREAAANIKRHGLELCTFNMVGSPGETVDDVMETIALNREIGTDHIRVNIAIPLAHTAFEETAFTMGFLDQEYTAGVGDMRTPEMKVDSPDRAALINLYLMFRAAIHGPIPPRTVRWLAERSPNRLLMALKLWGVFEEKRITGLGWLEGLRFYSHVGDPRRRTANYVTLI
jgi:anaerobic magnesium-protoporphyrin IX monomethyl ester cyclase